ncbi:MAG: hypothetical protein VX430_00600 [Pseudomonadota bacterium]|nr:hypothetical protein [Pseudomonadota bacterium]
MIEELAERAFAEMLAYLRRAAGDIVIRVENVPDEEKTQAMELSPPFDWET